MNTILWLGAGLPEYEKLYERVRALGWLGTTVIRHLVRLVKIPEIVKYYSTLNSPRNSLANSAV